MWSTGNESGQSDPPLWPGAPSGGGGHWSGNGGAYPNQAPWLSPTNPGNGGWGSPSPQPTPAPAPVPQRSMSVPFRMNLRNGVHDGLIISIKGVVKPNADRFTVDLGNREDIALHFNPRFNEGGQQVVVRNSCQRKKWGQEERNLGRFPFARGKEFEMEILCTSSEFKVSVDRSPVLTFKHRITDLRSINTVSINNDLDLINVDQRTR